ncbi:MAG: VTT domain-containing protein [Alphaproteobacteria bacterium]|nr:VTT domain-containing protein [Alphaproteobacteria bacterium]
MTHANNNDTLFHLGENCEFISTADHAAVLIDCANYYNALYESICNAKHSIFVLGWDIDGRIKLCRDGNKKNPRFFDLIQWKAKENPDLQVFLNRWDYSIFMAKDREAFGSWRWRNKSASNVHYCLDGATPLGASHHQKIIVIDDEVAYCGGMDIALDRWDQRDHMPCNHKRIDPGAIDSQLHKFEPYHDTQMVMSGPVVEVFSKIARDRWKLGTGEETITMRQRPQTTDVPPAWPQSTKSQFTHVDLAISRTLPQWGAVEKTHHIKSLYIDMINKAENFIYMENQFLSQDDIAQALNDRLLEKPKLQVLLVSCYDPQGAMQRKSLWQGRVRFRDLVEANGVADRVTMASVITRFDQVEKPVRIHSKLTVVDDTYLRVGSSNINNRSMYMDTECDVVIEAKDAATRTQIAAIRNDLIREHTGQEIKDIQQIIDSQEKPEAFLKYLSHSCQHLRKINDEQYRYERFAGLANFLADPKKPLIPVGISMFLSKIHTMRVLMVVIAIALMALIWKFTPLAEYATPETIVPILEEVRNTPWSVPLAMAIYTIATLLFFPHMAMTATIVLVFSPLQAFSIAMTGSLVSGAIGFWIGRKLGMRSMRALLGNVAEKVSVYAKKGGLGGITLLRLLPVAPYTAVNLALGMLEISFWVFMGGTFLGTLPGTVIAAYLGESVLDAWKNPNSENLMLLAGGLAAWISVVVGAHLAGKWWNKNHKPATMGHSSQPDKVQA